MADAVNPSLLEIDYPEARVAIIGQHGFNLFWIGLVTFICAFFIWKGKNHAIWLAAITVGLADLGYFLFLDLGGYVNFIPGTPMTFVSSIAIILSIFTQVKTRKIAPEPSHL